ncbi:hypothetical protein ccbrp13_45800 [Ktedonobacteria bacterium brp13]|nr:hypothetical protein ccbrp13_45800 [Ktedonobacteria bacterium brp13]
MCRVVLHAQERQKQALQLHTRRRMQVHNLALSLVWLSIAEGFLRWRVVVVGASEDRTASG